MARIRLHNEDWGFETNCFVCEPRNERGLQIPFFHDTDAACVIADIELSNDFSGAPNYVHGGVTLAVLDEAQAWACIAIGGKWAVTTETTTRFAAAVKVGQPYHVEARIVGAGTDVAVDDTMMRTEAVVLDSRGKVRATSSATFVVLGAAQAVRAGAELADGAERFMRGGSLPER